MNVRIYQINMKRDTNNVAFMNYESLPKFQGSSEIDSSLYDKVFEGEVNCFTLEKLYEIFNLEHPAGYKGRSMSVSDVVEIIDGNNGKSQRHDVPRRPVAAQAADIRPQPDLVGAVEKGESRGDYGDNYIHVNSMADTVLPGKSL